MSPVVRQLCWTGPAFLRIDGICQLSHMIFCVSQDYLQKEFFFSSPAAKPEVTTTQANKGEFLKDARVCCGPPDTITLAAALKPRPHNASAFELWLFLKILPQQGKILLSFRYLIGLPAYTAQTPSENKRTHPRLTVMVSLKS